MKNKILKGIRIITIPPIVVLVILIIFINYQIIIKVQDKILLMLFLGLVPILAYPLNYLFKGDRKKERKLAFILTLGSYLLGFIYATFFVSVPAIKFIYYIYFFSGVVLALFNIFKLRASGHIASVTGLVFLLAKYINPYSLIITLGVYLLVFYASYALKRHTAKELIFGSVSIVIAYLVNLLLI